jgi:2-polyprenyl-3-methyl-5-hydroxy-6-metoxy-1,4-benzoquinol methylase
MPMSSIKENLKAWSAYDWKEEGDEWSRPWGGSAALWNGTIYPRIQSVGDVPHILEIAPGYGRCTQYLVNLCDRLTVVDLARNCIQSCKKRFSSYPQIEYHVNDGKSLSFIDDNSIDFVFSWDSLVHANVEAISSYLKDLAKKMKSGGYGFIHHSNMGMYQDPNSGVLTVENRHWRDPGMSAKLFREFCTQYGLQCIAQEIVEWEPGVLSDTFSFFAKSVDKSFGETRIFENYNFIKEVENVRVIHNLFSPAVSRL